MSGAATARERARIPGPEAVDLKLEVVVIPVADVDRAMAFYGSLGWRLDADFRVRDDFRAVQMTPPGSPCSTSFPFGSRHRSSNEPRRPERVDGCLARWSWVLCPGSLLLRVPHRSWQRY